jgi:hypothetical protein
MLQKCSTRSKPIQKIKPITCQESDHFKRGIRREKEVLISPGLIAAESKWETVSLSQMTLSSSVMLKSLSLMEIRWARR